MADTLEQLIMALAQADSAVAGSDPYASPQASVDSIRWNPNEYGMGENAVASGLKGLLSGVFGAAGTDYKQRAAAEYRDVLSGRAKAPSVLPEELFSKAQNQLGMFKLLKEKDDADKLEAALTKDADRRQALKDYETKLEIKNKLDNKAEQEAAKKAGKEEDATKRLGASLDYVDDLFKQTEKIGMIEGFFSGEYLPNTAGGEKLRATGAKLTSLTDTIKGMEINDASKRALLAAVPAWNDSVATKQAKREEFKKLLGVLMSASGKNPPIDAAGMIAGGSNSRQEKARQILERRMRQRSASAPLG